jgi:ankyrin repeat protein
LDIAAQLLKAGADLFARNAKGETPAALAMAQGEDTLKVIVPAAGLAAKDKVGNTLLHYAAMLGDAKAAAWLIAAGADKSLRNIAGETASDIAAKRGNADLAAMLKPTS